MKLTLRFPGTDLRFLEPALARNFDARGLSLLGDPPWTITITAATPEPLAGDGLGRACKPVRELVAHRLRLKGERRVTWVERQARGPEGFKVEFRPAPSALERLLGVKEQDDEGSDDA